MGKKFGFSFSWKRALGLSGMRIKMARLTGVPTTRSGLERKLGRLMLRNVGCSGLLLLFLSLVFALGILPAR